MSRNTGGGPQTIRPPPEIDDMRRARTSALLAVAAVPALLAVPVAGRVAPAPHPVPPQVQRITLSGVDAAALAQLRPAPTGARRSGPANGAVPGARLTAAEVLRPAVLTPQRATRSFDLVAVSWNRGAAVPAVSVRVREAGRWTSWQPLGHADEAPDPGSLDAVHAASAGGQDATDPLLTRGADGVQVRVDTPTGRPPAGLSLDLVDAGRSAADSAGAGVAGPADAAQAASGVPGIVTRSEWGADESLVKAPPVINSQVRTLVLHHTDTGNSYSPAQAYAEIRSVYAFHTKVRGWNDIGYNFLVDRYGRVFEGRRGSLTSAVMGAHTGGFNSQSLGVAVLGTFSTTAAPSAAVDAVTNLMAWLAGRYGINPQGRTSVISAGGSYTQYPAGASVSVPGIVGHRDLGSTECPGNALYPLLPAIRAAVAGRMVPDLISPTLTGAPAVVGGAPVQFSAAVATSQRWWMTVTSLCGATPVRTQSGATGTRISASWDLKDATGAAVPPGTYTVTIATSSPVGTSTAWRQDVEVLPSTSSVILPAAVRSGTTVRPTTTALTTAGAIGAPTIGGCPVRRVATGDPALTSVIAGRLAQPDARTVVLVNATQSAAAFADVLAVAPLAAAKQAPLLLTGAEAIPDVVAQDLTARKVTTAWLVGSTTEIGPAVEQQLRSLGVTAINRIAGTDRWSAAAAVAAQVGAPAGTAVLAPADPGELLDTLVAAGPAAATGQPVLLTSAAGVPTATLAALRALRVRSVTVIGSTVAVPDATLKALAQAGVTSWKRLVGKGRWATAAAIAGTYSSRLPDDRVVLTSGLVAGVDLLIASAQGRPVLLTTADGLPVETVTWLAAHRTPLVALIASPALVRPAVIRAAVSARG